MSFLKTFWERADTWFAWLEKHLRVRVRFYLKDLAWLYSGQMVGILTALLLAFGYSHFLTKETYGTYKYLLAIFGFLAAFSLPGMSDATQRAIAQGREGVFWKTFRKRIEWATVGGMICAGVGLYYLYVGGNSLLGFAFLAASPFIVCIDSFTHYGALLMGRQLFRESSFYNATVQVAASVAIFITILFSKNVIVIIVVYLSAFVASRATVFFHVVRRFPPNKEHDEETIRIGTHMSMNNIIGMSANQLDAILLWHFLGPIPLAIFSFAEAAADQAQSGFKLVTTVMAFPKFSATDKETLKRTLPRKILLSFGLTIPLAIAIAACIPLLYFILFPQYTDSIPYAQVMTLMLGLMPTRFFSTALFAKGSVRTFYISNVSGVLCQIIFLFIFVPLYGIWGAILATFLQLIINIAVNIFLFYRM
ncbi:oligosaccharide flippase family protein [Candidatus Kaiserbacteria bacterium]|nr:oligosaccharide flippase family protein [Candidatus Kaiserbacteria bacterium]